GRSAPRIRAVRAVRASRSGLHRCTRRFAAFACGWMGSASRTFRSSRSGRAAEAAGEALDCCRWRRRVRAWFRIPSDLRSKRSLSVAVRDYDRTRPLTDGTVQIAGVDPVLMALNPDDIVFRG